MINFLNKMGMRAGAFVTASVIAMSVAEQAKAQTLGSVVQGTGESLTQVPDLVNVGCYGVGAFLVGSGFMKVKAHVDSPGQTPLREGLIRLVSGAGLCAAPVITQMTLNTGDVGTTGTSFTTFGEVTGFGG